MRWSIVRLIWFRELRDQLRDRRTVFMVVFLPLLLYPLLGVGVAQFARGFTRQTSTLGLVGADNLPAATSYPPLFHQEDGAVRFAPKYFDSPLDAETIIVRQLTAPEGASSETDRTPLESKQVDLILIVPPNFCTRLEHEEQPAIQVRTRDDDRSRLLNARVQMALARWKKQIREIRLQRLGLPASLDDPFIINDTDPARATGARTADGLFDMLVRVFPFMLVMWSLAGALYPAVDLCAGEKERGTMETLLITPASREEIVWGKFLTIWVFSGATTLLNLASMGLSTWQFSGIIPGEALRPAPLLWCVVLLLPTSAFFSALCLAVGAYARSSKEGQYYLMPLFLLSMPLIFLTLAPGVELNALYSMVPLTGVALLLQRLMTTSSAEQIPWIYFVPVMAPLLFYSWLALRWAVEQFKREEVLFREAERLDIWLWLRGLFRDKEATPSTAMAFACFALVIALHWLALGLGPTLTAVQASGIGLLAFMAAPPLLMALMLTRRPAESLGLRRPSASAVLSAVLLAGLLMPPLVELTNHALRQLPEIEEMLRQRNALGQTLAELSEHRDGADGPSLGRVVLYLVTFALLPAVCEELAFRGFILTGLRRRFRTGTAVVICSFLFAVSHLNVFQFLPAFVLGVVLGILAVRSGSVVPGMAYHLAHNGLLIGVACAEQLVGVPELFTTGLVRFIVVALGTSLSALVLLRLVQASPGVPPTRVVRLPARQGAACS